MPETRALFVRYQTLIRVGATRASIIRSWSAKTAAQKRVWVAAYHDCTTEDNNVVTASAAANVADVGVAAAEALINNDPASWRRLKTERVAATARFTELKAALGRQRDVWEALRGIEAAQSHPAPLSTNHALNQRNAAANAIRACDARLAAYERLRAYPPVPLDGGGLAKMPAKWVSCWRLLITAIGLALILVCSLPGGGLAERRTAKRQACCRWATASWSGIVARKRSPSRRPRRCQHLDER